MHYACMKDRKMLVSRVCLSINPVIRFSQKTNASLLAKNAFFFSIRQFIFDFSLRRIAHIKISQMYTYTYIKGQVTCGTKIL